jgi:hypothetical protein
MFICNKELKQFCVIKIEEKVIGYRCVLWLLTNYVIPQQVTILIIALDEGDEISLPITLCNLNMLIRQLHLWWMSRL